MRTAQAGAIALIALGSIACGSSMTEDERRLKHGLSGIDGVSTALERGDVFSARSQFAAIEPLLHEIARDVEVLNPEDGEVLHDIIAVVRLRLESPEKDIPTLLEIMTRMSEWFGSAPLVLSR